MSNGNVSVTVNALLDTESDSTLATKTIADKLKLDGKLQTPTTNYVPHHGVVNSNKPEKVRVLFDAAAKFQDTS